MKGGGHLSAPADVFFFCLFYHALVLEAVSKRGDLPHPVCRYCFPFGRPDGALKATLSLQERVREPPRPPASPVRRRASSGRVEVWLHSPGLPWEGGAAHRCWTS